MISQACSINDRARIKWGYALSQITDLPGDWETARDRVRFDPHPPRHNDVLISQVVEIGRHARLDRVDLTKTRLFEGDLIGMAFSPRYATRQFEAIVPDSLDEIHFVCAGGVIGQVVNTPDNMKPPTLLRPLGYLTDAAGERVNLRDYALSPMSTSTDGIDIIIVVGSAMDSGKTTAAYSLVNGLARGGHTVSAAKITGTASAKDPVILGCAGAHRVLDFTNAGFASTADLDAEELRTITRTVIAHLAVDQPDAIVLEIADGITQRETTMLLDLLAERAGIRGVIYTCNDSLGVSAGVSRIESFGLTPLAVSGTVTASPLSIIEAQQETSVPVLSREDLRSPLISKTLGLCGQQAGDQARSMAFTQNSSQISNGATIENITEQPLLKTTG